MTPDFNRSSKKRTSATRQESHLGAQPVSLSFGVELYPKLVKNNAHPLDAAALHSPLQDVVEDVRVCDAAAKSLCPHYSNSGGNSGHGN